MSSGKISDLLIEEVIARIKKEYSLKGEKEVAELIGISPQNFSKKKNKKTVINDIFEWALISDKDLNLLFKGKKEEGVSAPGITQWYLRKIDEWISDKLIDDPRTANWFEIEFEKTFQEFKKWKEEKVEPAPRQVELKKQANSTGWK